MAQTSVTAAPEIGLPGQRYDQSSEAESDLDCVVSESAGIPPGVVVMRTSEGDRAVGLPPATAADDDAIMTATATSASQQILGTGGTAFDGVIAGGRISPPSKITAIRSSNANQDAVAHVFAGFDENGVPVSESITGADGGGDTLTTTAFFSRLTSVTIAAQAGTGGTTKLGVLGPASRTLDGGDVLGLAVHTHRTKVTTTGSSDNEVYEDEMSLPVGRKGRFLVRVENAFRAGDVPCVRVAAGTGTQRGAIRAHDLDTATCIPWRKARLLNTGSAAGIGILEIDAL